MGGINTTLKDLNQLFGKNGTMKDIKGKNVFRRVNRKDSPPWGNTVGVNGGPRHNRQLPTMDRLIVVPLIEIHRALFNDPTRRDYGRVLLEPSWPVRDLATTDTQGTIRVLGSRPIPHGSDRAYWDSTGQWIPQTMY